MAVKHWTFAGLILTYWCNAKCACCYLKCAPDLGGNCGGGTQDDPAREMSVEQAVDFWRQLIEASPHGCRIHISGGEPFGDWERLIELCRAARREGLAPLQKVETNAFWATDEAVIRDRLIALNDAGMEKLAISCDPYHQQFVPIERCRLLARMGEDILGSSRVQVRWRDWMMTADGPEQSGACLRAQGSQGATDGSLIQYAAGGRDRMNGRAAELLANCLLIKPLESFADSPCRDALLRGRHVHVDSCGLVMPGTCAGIVLGRLQGSSVISVWHALCEDHTARPIVGTLANEGPLGLLKMAREKGFMPQEGYASKCHLCWQVRKHLAGLGLHTGELGPRWMYERE